MWECTGRREMIPNKSEVCWNCGKAKSEGGDAASAGKMVLQDEIPYHFRTLLTYGKLISGFGWGAVALGAVLCSVGLVGSGDLGGDY